MTNFEDFIGSYSFDFRLAPYDIIGSVAHVRMLAKCRIIPQKDARKIVSGLLAIARDIERGKPVPKEEDIHYAVEKELTRRIGPVGGRMHTARSRNDQVALDLRLYVRDRIRVIDDLIAGLQQAILDQAERNADAVMPGYTHLQPAQPVLFSHHILSYAWMFQRDRARLADCLERVNVLPLGSAALAGTSFPIDRRYVAKLLSFKAVGENSIDGVSDRDFAAEFLSVLSLAAMHLSRLAEELVIWSSAEFEFIRMAEEFTSGSSIMPQKRNPDVAEIVRGKTGRVYGDYLALMTILKGLPLAYNRDLQEDKPPVFDAVDSVESCLSVTAPMIATMSINRSRMLSATGKGFLAATELADYLTARGLPFRESHGIVKAIVRQAVAAGSTLERLSLRELRKFSPLFGEDAVELIEPAGIVRRKTSEGGTSPASVKRQIKRLRVLCGTQR